MVDKLGTKVYSWECGHKLESKPGGRGWLIRASGVRGDQGSKTELHLPGHAKEMIRGRRGRRKNGGVGSGACGETRTCWMFASKCGFMIHLPQNTLGSMLQTQIPRPRPRLPESNRWKRSLGILDL